MEQARVLVLSGKSLMLQGLLRWLSQQEGIEIMGLDVRAPQLNEQMEEFCPDVIILDEEDINTNGNLTVAELMQRCPDAKVVKIDPNSNIIRVVQQRRMTVAGVDDLLCLLTSG